MNFKFLISKRLIWLRDKHLAEGLNDDEYKEYFFRIIEFIINQVLVKVFKFDKEETKQLFDKAFGDQKKH